MVGTRRKSKAAAAAASAAVAESSTRDNSPVPVDATLSVVIPDDVDADVLDTLLPGVSLTSPSPDAIVSLYRLIMAQASETDATQRELEETRAEVERKDVELDQALQDRESATAELEATLGNVQFELAQVKKEKEELAASRDALQAQITSLSTTQSVSSTEVETLKHRVEDTEREKRDLVGVISRLKEDVTQRDEEIQNVRSHLKAARHEYQEVERQLREVRSTENSTRFKLDSVSQQLQLARDEVDRTNKELMDKSEEHTKYRRGKHAEIAQLQAAHDALVQSHASTEGSFRALQSAHNAQSHQLTQALTRVQELSGQLATQESAYLTEVAGLKRLVDMMEVRESQAKAVVEGIEKQWQDVGGRSDRREAALLDEIETHRQRAEEAEKRVDELQRVLEKVDRGEFPVPSTPGAPSTPIRGLVTRSMNGTPDFLTQGMMDLSPTVAMASRSQRSGKTFTEVYADYVRLQEDYARKSAEYEHMDLTLSQVLAQIEERAPVLTQQRVEYDRLKLEADQIASQLAEALSERDGYATAAEENAQKLAKTARENALLEKQLEDLGRQVQDLTRRIGRQQDPSFPSDDELEQDEGIKPAENIEDVITNHLVLFRSIPELQEQNQKLLRIVRELGAKMESEEKDYKEALEKEQAEAVREAHQAIKQLQEQLGSQKKSSDAMVQAYVKECDSLRSMLSRERSSGRTHVTLNNGDVNGHHAEASSQPELAKELSEIQSQFDAYRTEMGVDSERLREDALAAQREANKLSASLAKAQARVDFLEGRQNMLQEQIATQDREMSNLTKRNQHLYDSYTRLDIECNRVTEDLMTSNSLLEKARNECANLRAEKRIWESIQGRLVEENKALAVERSHLSDLMANVQRMHGDLERSGENDRRRLESQIQMLENQTQDLRTQLGSERESLRHLTLQKDIQVKELQTRIDKTAEEFAKTRESLVAAETSKTHLEERVDHLTKQLQGNEEKLAVYERRSSGVNGIAHRMDEDMPREQQLEAEVAELRSALKVAEVDLASARSHVQQFQEISQANEMALASLNATHDEYKASTEAELARHKSEYDALQARLQAVQQDLAQTSEKHSELQSKFESERVAWANDKRTLEDAIVDMSTLEKNTESDRTSRESEFRQQEERVKAAEERYSHEVLAHADAIKIVEELKQQLSNVQSATRNYQAAAETAESKLATSEASWKQQKDALDKEAADLNARCKDLAVQNSLLHQHLESVSSQASRIREAANSSVSVSSEGESADDADTKLSELRSVVSYLRREKEIVDLQLELSKQENARQKAQVDHLAQNLEETRKALSEERERAVEAAASEAQHAELVERINQLTILRESNATLRADCEAHARRSRELDAKFKQVSAELEPVKEQLRIAQAELEAKEQVVKRAEAENQRWKERNSQLLSKYDRIDPAEVQSLKEEIDQLKSQKAETETATAERDQRIATLTDTITQLESSLKKRGDLVKSNNEKARSRIGRMEESARQMQAQLESLSKERDELQAQVAISDSAAPSREPELSQQVGQLLAEKAALEKSLFEERAARSSVSDSSELTATITLLREERDKLLAEKASWVISSAAAGTPAEVPSQWESEKVELIKVRDEAVARAEVTAEEVRKVRDEIKNIRFQNEKFQIRIQDLNKSRAADSERAASQQQAAVTAAVEKLRSELQSIASPAASDEIISRHAQELRELEERLTSQYQAELNAATARQESISTTPGDHEASIKAAIAAHEEQMKEQREQEIAAAVERGRMEQAAKSKLKDAQLVRAQAKLKDCEARIQGWRQAGLIPDDDASSSAAPAAKATAAPTPATASTSGSTAPSKTLPRKPSMAQAGPSTETAGRGRGIRGAARGAFRGAAGRGGARGESSTATATDGTPGEVSIIGAAAKRAREEGEGSSDDTLAKRLKPDGTGKPVHLLRNRVAPPS
ncbi:hypothetical protein B0H21DRAFT_731535 [Amylocystis lapponica]|nr:hypothetical protein B0H21DRAFT_731535 [Amylocystis lapponica]